MTEFDLWGGLRDLRDAPRIEGPAVDVDRVTARVHRTRAVRGAGAAVGSVAVVAGLVVGAWAAAPWSDPVPPADPTPPVLVPPSPTTSPNPEPSSTPSPTESGDDEVTTEDPPDGPRPVVAVTADGEIVLIDPTSGEQLAVVTDGIATGDNPGKVTLDVDDARTVAYVSQRIGDRNELLRVSLADGTSEPLLVGTDVGELALSPDGTALAFTGPDPNAPSGTGAAGLSILDLATGDVRHLTSGAYNPARLVGSPEWAPDGQSIYIELGWPEVVDLYRIDLASTTSLVGLEEGRGEAPEESRRLPQVLADGRLLVAATDLGLHRGPEGYRTLVLDAGGDVVGEVDGLAGMEIRDTASPTAGTSVALLARDAALEWAWETGLYVWDGTTATLVAEGDLVAIAW